MNEEPDVNDVVRILAEQNTQLTVELALAKATIIKLRAAQPAAE